MGMPQLDLSAITQKPEELSGSQLQIYYGQAGSGKTWLAASSSLAPGRSPVLIIDTEGSTPGTIADFEGEDIEIIQVRSVGNEENKTIGLDTFLEVWEALCTQPHKYKTIVIDTFDVLQEQMVKKIVKESGTNNTQRAWGEVGDWTIEFVRQLQANPALGILVMHASREQTPEGEVYETIMLSGRAKGVVPGIPDVVAKIERTTVRDEEGDYHLGTMATFFGSSHVTVSKARFRLPVTMENPTMAKIDAITERKKEK